MTTTTTLLEAGQGHGRLLVRSPDGRRLGWHDLASGTTHLTDVDAGPAVADAVAQHVARNSPLRSRRVLGLLPAQRSVPAVVPVAEAAPSEDLRERPPGGTRVSELLELLELLPPRSESTLPCRLLRRHRLPDRARSLLVDVLTAREVAAVLGPAATWSVLHDVPAGDARVVDHLLLGPGGVVVLGRASARAPHAGEASATEPVTDRVRLVRAVLAEVGAGRVPVRGAVVTARRGPVTRTPGEVTHLRVDDLPGWLGDSPRVVSSVDLTRLVDAAARRELWPGPEAPVDAQEIRGVREVEQETFARLLGELRLDRRRRPGVAGRIRG